MHGLYSRAQAVGAKLFTDKPNCHSDQHRNYSMKTVATPAIQADIVSTTPGNIMLSKMPMPDSMAANLTNSYMRIPEHKRFCNPNFVVQSHPKKHSEYNTRPAVIRSNHHSSSSAPSSSSDTHAVKARLSSPDNHQPELHTDQAKQLTVSSSPTMRGHKSRTRSKSTSHHCRGRQHHRGGTRREKQQDSYWNLKHVEQSMQDDVDYEDADDACAVAAVPSSPKSPRLEPQPLSMPTASPCQILRAAWSEVLMHLSKPCHSTSTSPVAEWNFSLFVTAKSPPAATLARRQRLPSEAPSEDSVVFGHDDGIIFDDGDEESSFNAWSEEDDDSDDDGGESCAAAFCMDEDDDDDVLIKFATSCSTTSEADPERDVEASKSSAATRKVRFASPSRLCKVHHLVAWSYAMRASRRGPWEAYGRDDMRFHKRIDDLRQVIDPVLAPAHRNAIYMLRFSGDADSCTTS